MSDPFERDLGVFMRGPGLADENVARFLRELSAADDAYTELEITLSRAEVMNLSLVFKWLEKAPGIISQLAAASWGLDGMAQFAKRRAAEVLAANYATLRAGGTNGNGELTLRRHDMIGAGADEEEWTEHYSLGGPLDPKEAVKTLRDFYCQERASGIVSALYRARKTLGPDWEQELAQLPSKGWKPSEERERPGDS
jgi:hypothetical protein